MKQYSRMTYAVRCQISALMQAKLSVPQIAKQLGYHKSSIYREIKRNTTLKPRSWSIKEYHPLRAQGEMIERKKRCRRRVIIASAIESKIIEQLEQGWSPEIIAGRLKREKICSISYQTIYRYIKYNPILKKYFFPLLLFFLFLS